MPETAINNFVSLMNRYGVEKEPFIFLIDYDMKMPEIHKLNSVPHGIKFQTPLISNSDKRQIYTKPFTLEAEPVKYKNYLKAFRNVQQNISIGNTYLLNLTFPTLIKTEATLAEIFDLSSAKYKLLYHDHFTLFSPETFIRIEDGMIKSFPMKGTIDASLPDAEKVLMNNVKEEAEHNTIVDLIRNDLSKIAFNVEVPCYRYVERINTGRGELLQVSSEIRGVLQPGYESKLGDIIWGLLPAGSVTGAPKAETLKIIRESENYNRGWYTGVFGVFDGKALDSAVMIRFIENDSGKLIFKSGGGITCLSDSIEEYKELILKVYVPAD